MSEDVASVAWFDQVQAEFRDTACMAATYYAYLVASGLPEALVERMILAWHQWFLDQGLTFGDE